MPFLGFVGKFLKWIGGLWKAARSATQDLLPSVIEIVNNIKNFDATNPAFADAITALIPGTLDDKAVALLRQELPNILKVFVEAQTVAGMTDNELISYVAGKLQQETNGTKYAFNYTELAAMIVSALDDGKLTPLEWIPMVKFIYDNMHK